MAHAVLSPSSSERWINCPPSVRLSEEIPSESNEPSLYALEGTDAHLLCEHRLKEILGLETENPIENLSFYNEEMEECAEGYTSYVLEIVNKYKNPLVLIEERIDLTDYVIDSFGTADCVVVGNNDLHVIDYKHGQGILVDAEENSQLKLYALGILSYLDGIYDIEKITIHIYQPRRDNISTDTFSPDELYSWGEFVKERAELAFNGGGNQVPGDWCIFCPVKNVCRQRADVALEIAREEFKLPPILTDDEIEEYLFLIPNLKAWIKDLEDYALASAIQGKKWTNYKLVEGRSNRKYVDEAEVAKVIKEAGYKPYEKKIVGITAMTKLLGKKKFDELLEGLIEKPVGKPVLVARTDKREEIETVKDEFQKI